MNIDSLATQKLMQYISSKVGLRASDYRFSNIIAPRIPVKKGTGESRKQTSIMSERVREFCRINNLRRNITTGMQNAPSFSNARRFDKSQKRASLIIVVWVRE